MIIVTPRLVRPTIANTLRAPTDSFVPPSEQDIYFNGKPEVARTRVSRRAADFRQLRPYHPLMQQGIPAMLRALPILLLAGLGGCVYNPHVDMAPDYGEAVHANIASQVVNPVPLQPRAQRATTEFVWTPLMGGTRPTRSFGLGPFRPCRPRPVAPLAAAAAAVAATRARVVRPAAGPAAPDEHERGIAMLRQISL